MTGQLNYYTRKYMFHTKSAIKEEWKTKHQETYKQQRLEFNPFFLIIASHVNGLKSPIKILAA